MEESKTEYPEHNHSIPEESTEDFTWKSMIPRQGFLVTPIIIILNLLVFILMAFNGMNIMEPATQMLIEWGANYTPLTLNNESWRLFTSCFLHGGIFHLLMNMYALYSIGYMLEPLLGTQRFLIAYILSGIGGSVMSIWWHDITVSVGASGAIFGMYGLFLALLSTSLIEKTIRKELLSSIAFFVGFNLLFGLQGGIDNAAHIGGLLAGAITGYAYFYGLRNPGNAFKKNLGMLLPAALILAYSYYIINVSNPVAELNQLGKELYENEKLALQILKEKNFGPKELDAGIKYWEENLEILNDMNDSKLLSEDFRASIPSLRKYFNLRVKQYTLISKSISEKTEKYTEEIIAVQKEIKAMED